MGHIGNRKRRIRLAKERERSHIRNRGYEFERMKEEQTCYDLLNDMFDDVIDDVVDENQKMNDKLVDSINEFTFNTSKIPDESVTISICSPISSQFDFSYKDDTHNIDFTQSIEFIGSS